MSNLGRRVPPDWNHTAKYGIRRMLPVTVDRVEDVLPLPYHLRPYYDQGVEGACVAYALSWAMSILNRNRTTTKYDARWLYQAAQIVDDWPETPPEEGTSVRAGCDVLRDTGHRAHVRRTVLPPDPAHGIISNHWASSVDEIRTAIATGIPVTIGVNWYSDFDDPSFVGRELWIGEDIKALGRIRGGHAITIYGASDRRQAVKLVNSWGTAYPLVWMPYDTLQRLLDEDGEATIISDRITP